LASALMVILSLCSEPVFQKEISPTKRFKAQDGIANTRAAHVGLYAGGTSRASASMYDDRVQAACKSVLDILRNEAGEDAPDWSEVFGLEICSQAYADPIALSTTDTRFDTMMYVRNLPGHADCLHPPHLVWVAVDHNDPTVQSTTVLGPYNVDVCFCGNQITAAKRPTVALKACFGS
jgi:hypothetical protein